MKLRNLLFALLLTISIVPVACNKDDDDNGGGSELLQNISASSWKISGVTANGVDILTLIPECYLDNLVTFYADFKGKVDESAILCTPTTAGNFTWSLNPNQSEITLTTTLIPGGNNTFKIVSLSPTTFVLSQMTSFIPAPVPVEAVVTLVHP